MWVVQWEGLSVSTIGSYFLKLRKRYINSRLIFLSVSTIGSYFLKQLLRRCWRGRFALSVSTIGSYFLKLFFDVRFPILCRSFSIHYWIVFLETYLGLSPARQLESFQYPLLDRISWNFDCGNLFLRNDRLSVSTIGSYFLKLILVYLLLANWKAFSIHYWIVFLETRTPAARQIWMCCLSVSTIGSYFLKRDRTGRKPAGCDLSVSTIGSYFLKPSAIVAENGCIVLSVSTIGSYFLKRDPRDACWNSCLLSVSTIGSYFLKLLAAYPEDVDRELSVSTIGSYFLKPQSLNGWNLERWTFSIHYWIVFLETTAIPLSIGIIPFFQYPLLDRISWNPASSTISTLYKSFLSVSTIGSYFLKLYSCILTKDIPLCFQYPLLDRISWNFLRTSLQAVILKTFSIHYWIVFLETLVLVSFLEAFLFFQYPLLDRISWNATRQSRKSKR